MVISTDYHTLFSDNIWDRAKEYASGNRVTYLGVTREIRERGEKHVFSVSGSNRSEYTVIIRPGAYRGDFYATCTCPYDWENYCKHIGASIIIGLEEGIFSLIDYNGASVAHPVAAAKNAPRDPAIVRGEEKDLLFDLSNLPGKKTSRKALPSEVLGRRYAGRDTLFPDPPATPEPTGKTPRSYLLSFMIGSSDYPYHYGYSGCRDPLAVTPGAQYVKQDGSPGRYESYRDGQTFISLSDSERNLLTWLLDSETRSVPFGYALPRLLRDSTLRIARKINNTCVPASIEELQAIHITFEFGGLRTGDEPSFLPRVAFESHGALKESVPVSAVSYGESGIGLYLYVENDGVIYYTSGDSLDSRYLTRMLDRRDGYTINDILSIVEAIRSSFLKIEPPKGKILIKHTAPRLALYLAPRSGGTLVYPAFTYGSRTTETESAASLLKDDYVDDTLLVHRRDPHAEGALLKWFVDLCSRDIVGFHTYGLQMEVSEFLFRYGDACFNAGVDLFLKGDKRPISRSGSFSIVASSGIDWLDLRILVGGREVLPGDIDLVTGTVTVEGMFQLVDAETLARLRTLYESGRPGKESIRLSRFDLATLSGIEPLLEAGEGADLTRMRSALAGLARGFDTRQLRRPKGMVGTLRPYQKAGLKWLQFLAEFGFGGILADDMGLGKTIQAIALLAHLAERGIEGPYLVIAPVSTISNWVREIQRFAPGISAYPHIGPERPSDGELIVSYRGVVVTSYHTLQRDIELFEQVKWSQLILDESQSLKNPASKSHRTVRRLDFSRVLAMSGTPVENNIQELWSVMSILNPGLLGTKTEFLKRFRKRISEGDEQTIEKLRTKLRPFLLRRTKDQVASDLPAKEEVSIDVSLSSAETAFYDALKARLREEVMSILLSDEPFRAAQVILTALTKLRQAAIAPSLVGGPAGSSKLDEVMNRLDEAVSEGHKILVFSQYVRVLQMLVARVRERKWNHCYLDGSISAASRKRIIDRFRNDPDTPLFLISLKAGGVGINLTEADYVFLVDPWWNPAVESQAIDRTHRIGQTKPVFAYRFLCRGTIEERILELQETKRALVKNVIGEDASMLKSLSKDEIIGLFE
jgi:superfamily II DNA or RNA helicase